jgi:intracellular septation protein A
MSATGQTLPARSALLRVSYVQILLPLLLDVALPLLIYFALTSRGVATLPALVASGLAPLLNNLRGWFFSRRLEPLGIIMLTFIAVSAAASLISGSVLFALVKDSLLTGAFGLVCLVSLLLPRPLLFYVTRQFVAADDPEKLGIWNGFWQIRSFRVAMYLVTAVWGVVFALEATARVVMALKLPPAEVVSLSPIMGFGTLALLIVWTRRTLRAERERREGAR